MVTFSFDDIKKIWEAAQSSQAEQSPPRILVAGKTGVGKSSVLNAILGKHVYEIGVTPTTKINSESLWQSDGGEIIVMDVPGFGEADSADINGQDYEDNITTIATLKAHIVLLVLKCDDRALELESNYIKKWKAHPLLSNLPIIVVVNQIDKMKPVRIWEPQSLNLQSPVTEKEKNIRSYIDYVSSLQAFHSFTNRTVPISAGESFDSEEQYGITDLKDAIYEALPDAAKTKFARAANFNAKEAKRIIKYYATAAAAAVGANPVIASDAFIIAPIQIAMISHIAKLHRIEVSIASVAGLLSSLVASFAGRSIVQVIVSFIPIAKNLAGPPLAFLLTYSMGLLVNELFKEGKTKASDDTIDALKKKIAPEAEMALAVFNKK